jgi:hypothetical protein
MESTFNREIDPNKQMVILVNRIFLNEDCDLEIAYSTFMFH